MNSHRTVINRIPEADDGIHRPLPRSSFVVLHRTVEGSDAVCAAERYVTGDLRAYTGGEIPYHFWVQPDGQVVQLIPLSQRGAHAISWNPKSYSVAFMHNADKSPIPHVMQLATMWILQLLCAYAGGVVGYLFGHDEIDGARKDVSKRCPGRYVNMHVVRGLLVDRVQGDLLADAECNNVLLCGVVV